MGFHKILVAVKGNGGADEEAIKLACHLAKENGAEVYALYIIEVGWGIPLDAHLEREIRRGEEVLKRAEEKADEQDCQMEGELLQAREAGAAIVDEAVEKGVDLIIMGLPYKRRFGEFSLGNTVPYVLKNAPCHVYLCREPSP